MTVCPETCLYVGRFQPPHVGHIAVLAGLAAKYSRLIAGISEAHISHTPKNPLTGGERYELLRAICDSLGLTGVDIVPIPVDPFPTTWVPAIASIVPRFDCVYGRNPMHSTIFEHWGYPIVSLDGHERPTSGTEVREMMAKGEARWRGLVPEPAHHLIEEFGLEDRLRRLSIDRNI